MNTLQNICQELDISWWQTKEEAKWRFELWCVRQVMGSFEVRYGKRIFMDKEVGYG